MSNNETNKYTILTKRIDKRTKKGYRIISQTAVELTGAEADEIRNRTATGTVVELLKWVDRVNLMTGKTYKECPLTPVYMSPARESYWCM